MGVPETTKGGEFNYYWQQHSKHKCKTITVKDFNCNIEFNRNEGEKHNNISVFNGNTKYEISRVPNSKDVYAAPIFSGDEQFALEHIFNRDQKSEDFSKEDLDYLMNNRNKVIKLSKKYAYKVIATDQEIATGKVTVELRDILADGSTRKTGRRITIDIETQNEAEAAKKADAPKEKTSFWSRILPW